MQEKQLSWAGAWHQTDAMPPQRPPWETAGMNCDVGKCDGAHTMATRKGANRVGLNACTVAVECLADATAGGVVHG